MASIDFWGETYEVPTGYVAVHTRAVTAGDGGLNRNFDFFPSDELEKAASTYDGCDLVFVNHTYTFTDDDASDYDDGIDRSRTRGYIMAQHYDQDSDALYLLVAVNKRFHELTDLILDGSIGSVSMGCTCHTFCSICGGEFDDVNPCECGACPTFIGTVRGSDLVYDILRDISFYELSLLCETSADAHSLFVEVVDCDASDASTGDLDDLSAVDVDYADDYLYDDAMDELDYDYGPVM